MTNLHAQASVTFRVLFTPDEVAALKFAADTHYDAVCRTFQPVMILAQYIAHEIEPSVVLDWRDLDILSKICESPNMPRTVADDVWATFAKLRRATEALQKVLDAS